VRTLNDYFLYGGTWAELKDNTDVSDTIAVVTDAGRVYSYIINVHTAIGGATPTSFDILLNDADTGVDCVMPGGLADETGFEMVMPAEIHVEPGDALGIRSNGEQVANTAADGTWVIRR